MKRCAIWLSLLLLLSAVPVLAQAPNVSGAQKQPRAAVGISPGEVTPTAEMWFYQERMRQYMDPKMNVRQKAEFRTSQRQARISARQWFGLSNLRPTAGTDNIHNDYSPGWSGNTVYHPFRWSGVGPAIVVMRPDRAKTLY